MRPAHERCPCKWDGEAAARRRAFDAIPRGPSRPVRERGAEIAGAQARTPGAVWGSTHAPDHREALARRTADEHIRIEVGNLHRTTALKMELRYPSSCRIALVGVSAAHLPRRRRRRSQRGRRRMPDAEALMTASTERWEASPDGLSGRLMRGHRHWRYAVREPQRRPTSTGSFHATHRASAPHVAHGGCSAGAHPVRHAAPEPRAARRPPAYRRPRRASARVPP